MASKKQIVDKIKILISTKFDDPKSAFEFFDKDSDGSLNKKEIKKLLKSAKISRWLQSIVAAKIIEGLDKNKGKSVDWKEFQAIIKDISKDKAVKES